MMVVFNHNKKWSGIVLMKELVLNNSVNNHIKQQ